MSLDSGISNLHFCTGRTRVLARNSSNVLTLYGRDNHPSYSTRSREGKKSSLSLHKVLTKMPDIRHKQGATDQPSISPSSATPDTAAASGQGPHGCVACSGIIANHELNGPNIKIPVCSTNHLPSVPIPQYRVLLHRFNLTRYFTITNYLLLVLLVRESLASQHK